MADNEQGTEPEGMETEKPETEEEAREIESEPEPEPGPSGLQFLDREARCNEDSEEDEEEEEEEESYEELFTRDTESEEGDAVDNATAQGSSLALFVRQEAEENERQLEILKRKYACSPGNIESEQVGNALSPRLQAMSITPQKRKKARKELFAGPGSATQQREDEASNNAETLEATGGNEQVSDSGVASEGPQESEPDTQGGGNGEALKQSWDSHTFVTSLLKQANTRACVLAQLKESLLVSFTEMTRSFKSNKTVSGDWVVGAVGVKPGFYESALTQLQEKCSYILAKRDRTPREVPIVIMLLRFNHQKNRDTVMKTMRSVLQVHEAQIIMEPPRINSVPAALYWVKLGDSPLAYKYGDVPQWIANQTSLSHAITGAKPFVLSTMVQWAYDNDYTEESIIALEYAMQAEGDENAAAFINSNCQAKFVRDCATMVRYYKRAEMHQMNMGEWLHRCGLKVDCDPQDWRVIVHFLRNQRVEFIPFLARFKYFLQGIPKKNCLCIHGPPDTGKSMFAMSLMKYMGGKVLSFVNSKSQFWLQPLGDAKIGLIDDVTRQFWDYCDTYLRTGLDGNPISLDCKHRAPVQLKFPPLLITTNVSVESEDRWIYLQSRIKTILFPTVQGSTRVQIENRHWKSFFHKFWLALELPEVDEEDGNTRPALRLNPRPDPDAY